MHKMIRLMIAFIFFSSALQAEGNVLSGHDVVTLVTRAIAAQGEDHTLQVHLNEAREEDVIANSSAIVTAAVDNLTLDRPAGRWNALLLLKEADRNLPPLRISGTYDTIVTVPMLKHTVKSGEVIQAEDVELTPQPARRLRQNMITDMAALIGKSPKRIISAGRAIRLDEIANPSVVVKGTRITLIYKTPNLEIKTLGEAMDNGAKGDVIRVRNLASKQTIGGKVETADTVRVTSPNMQHALAEE